MAHRGPLVTKDLRLSERPLPQSRRSKTAALRQPPNSKPGSLRRSELQAREIRLDVPSCREVPALDDLPALEIVEALELGVEIGLGGEVVGHT